MDLGYSYNTTDPDEIAEAAEHLKEQKPLVQAHVMDEIYDKMEGGEAALAPYYNGDAVLMMEVNDDLDFYLPDETSIFIDSMCIPTGAENKEAAELYINYMCEATIAAANSYYVGYSTPIHAAYELLDEDLQENEIAYPDAEMLAGLDSFHTLPEETNNLIDSYWTEIMASSSSVWIYIIIFVVIAAAAVAFVMVRKNIKRRRMDY